MATGFFYHEKFLQHQTGPYHPEDSGRLTAIIRGLKEAHLWEKLVHVTPQPATEKQVLLVHSKRHFDYIQECAEEAPVQIDPDTAVSAASFDAAMLAAGASVEAVDGILDGKFTNAFAAVRPPGHHATSHRAMGFCLFNNIAIAARHLVRTRGLRKVLIMDWDVHHGNGTQDIFYSDPAVVYISLHKRYHYPGTGWEDETGDGAAEGTKRNIPIGNPYSAALYEEKFREALLWARPFAPDFVLISCGFDAHERDPLGNLGLRNETYARLTRQILQYTAQFGHQRVFSILEGGYDYAALGDASAAHVSVLLEG
ncbi:MAG TPA: histone deacetylase [Acidobacteriota bacterium]|nr:histone deacetylase [Acidobacteriota bacterium]